MKEILMMVQMSCHFCRQAFEVMDHSYLGSVQSTTRFLCEL